MFNRSDYKKPSVPLIHIRKASEFSRLSNKEEDKSVLILNERHSILKVDIKNEELLNVNKLIENLKNARNGLSLHKIKEINESNLALKYENSKLLGLDVSENKSVQRKSGDNIKFFRNSREENSFNNDLKKNSFFSVYKLNGSNDKGIRSSKAFLHVDNDTKSSKGRNIFPKNNEQEDKNNSIFVNQNKNVEDVLKDYLPGKENHPQMEEISSLSNESLNSESFQKYCIICDILLEGADIYGTENCFHYFCLNCGKLFYENQIEEGNITMTCPIFSCESNISFEIIKRLISNEYYENLSKKRNSNQTNKKLPTLNSLKKFNENNVMIMTTHDEFITFNQNKQNFCLKCKEPALFTKTNKRYVKCMNCANIICKFCWKSVTVDHYTKTSLNYCRQYFRKKKDDEISLKMGFCRTYLITLFLYFASFFLILSLIYKIINDYFNRSLFKNNKKSKICNLIQIIMISILLIPIIIIMLLIIPYYPAILAIFDVVKI